MILDPLHDPEEWKGLRTVGGERYPQVGEVVAKGETVEDIRLGDFALITVESSDIARTYERVFALLLDDFGQALFDADREPAIREAVERYRANPSDRNSKIRTTDLTGQSISFDASDVLDMGWEETSNPGFRLLYPEQVRMFTIWHGPHLKLFYEVHEDHILGVIR